MTKKRKTSLESFNANLATDLSNHAAKQALDAMMRVVNLSDDPIIKLSIVSVVMAETAKLMAGVAGRVNMPEKTFQMVTVTLVKSMENIYRKSLSEEN